jgi:hypothetical protein
VTPDLHKDVDKKLGCSADNRATPCIWYQWLAERGEGERNTMYNLHRLTQWFFTEMVGKANTSVTAAQQ